MRHWISKVVPSAITILVFSFAVFSGFANEKDCDEAAVPSAAMKEALAKLSKEMHEEVEALRGWKFKEPVDVGFFSAEEIRAFMSGDDEEGEEGEGNLDAELSQRAYEFIGVIAEGSDPEAEFEEAMMASVPDGIYDHIKKELRLYYHEDFELDTLSTRMTLAHELGHALDDQHFDLSALEEQGGGTSDMHQVWGAIIEGSGVTIQDRYKLKAKDRFDTQKYKESTRDEMKGMKTLFEAPPFVASFMARFPCGMRFLQGGDFNKVMALFMEADDPGSVGDMLRSVTSEYPRSFEQILHPEKYFDTTQKDEPVVIDDDAIKETLARFGLHVAYTDTLGELFCAMVSDPEDRVINPMLMAAPGYWTNQGGIGWGGDRLYLLASESVEDATKLPDDLCALWITAWDSPSDCKEFVSFYERHRDLPDRVALTLGDAGVAFFFGFPEDLRQRLVKSLAESPPKCTRDDKPWSWSGRLSE